MTSEDTIIAFFPCVRFSRQNILNIRGMNYGMKKWSLIKKLQYSINNIRELAMFYELISNLVIIAIQRKIPLIIENPYGEQHFLTRYWVLQPALIDYDRRLNGDTYKKPTQYWFINCEPQNNIIDEPIEKVENKNISNVRNQVERSMIQPQYANRFLRQYVLPQSKD